MEDYSGSGLPGGITQGELSHTYSDSVSLSNYPVPGGLRLAFLSSSHPPDEMRKTENLNTCQYRLG